MSGFESQYFVPRSTSEALLIFLHGYHNSRNDMAYIYSYLSQKFPCLLIAAPDGHYSSSHDPSCKSWYKLSGFDSSGKRHLEETPISEIIAIYDQAGPALCETAQAINHYIDDVQKHYGFTDCKTFLAGFSQGAMLALWTALTRTHPLGGCFSFAGLVAAPRILNSQIASRPPVYLLHGTKDDKVLPKCMTFTENWLKEKDIPVMARRYENTIHTVSYEEMDFMINIIKKNL